MIIVPGNTKLVLDLVFPGTIEISASQSSFKIFFEWLAANLKGFEGFSDSNKSSNSFLRSVLNGLGFYADFLGFRSELCSSQNGFNDPLRDDDPFLPPPMRHCAGHRSADTSFLGENSQGKRGKILG